MRNMLMQGEEAMDRNGEEIHFTPCLEGQHDYEVCNVSMQVRDVTTAWDSTYHAPRTAFAPVKGLLCRHCGHLITYVEKPARFTKHP